MVDDGLSDGLFISRDYRVVDYLVLAAASPDAVFGGSALFQHGLEHLVQSFQIPGNELVAAASGQYGMKADVVFQGAI